MYGRYFFLQSVDAPLVLRTSLSVGVLNNLMGYFCKHLCLPLTPGCKQLQRFLFLTGRLFSFYRNRSGPGVLNSGDIEEMDVQPVKGKSFISVDPLGQVDWSWAFWFGFYFAFFSPPTETTLLPQLLQTVKVMGLRFCPDKGVRTLSLLLTPLSHHWDQDAWEIRWGEHRGAVSQSLPPCSCLKPSATELPPAFLYLIPKPAADSRCTRPVLSNASKGPQTRAYSWMRLVGRKCLRIIYQVKHQWLASNSIKKQRLIQIAFAWLES